MSSAFLTNERDKTSVSGVLSDSSLKSLTNCSKRLTSRLNAFWSSLRAIFGSARGGRGESSVPLGLLASGTPGMCKGDSRLWPWPPACMASHPARLPTIPVRKNLRHVFIGFSRGHRLGRHLGSCGHSQGAIISPQYYDARNLQMDGYCGRAGNSPCHDYLARPDLEQAVAHTDAPFGSGVRDRRPGPDRAVAR